MKSRLLALIAALLAFTLIAAACGDDDDDDAVSSGEPQEETAEAEGEDEAAAEESGTVVDVAGAAGDFTTLVAAVDAADLVETLSGAGPSTVSAPNDAALAAALDSLGLTAEELLADTETLTSILTYHVVPGKVMAADVVTLDGQSVATVNGAEVTISVDGENVMVNEANVIAVDVEASNGVIHVIDSVLLPPA